MTDFTERKLKEFDEIVKKRWCKCCQNEVCTHETTGCPWYEDTLVLSLEGQDITTIEKLKSFITQTIKEAKREMADEAVNVVKKWQATAHDKPFTRSAQDMAMFILEDIEALKKHHD